MYNENKIQTQINKLNELKINNNACKKVIIGNSKFIDYKGDFLKRYYRFFKRQNYTGEELLLQCFKDHSINGCALLIPKKAFEECGTFNEELRYMQDTDMWFRIMLNGYNFVCTKEKETYNRVHENQGTVRLKHIAKKDRGQIGEYLIEELKDKYVNKKNLLLYYTYHCVKTENYDVAKQAISYLKKNRQINVIDIIKIKTRKIYGKIRPFMVRIYYKTIFKIKIKKEEKK